jgi:natural product precursor
MLKEIAQGKGLKEERKLNKEELNLIKGGWGCGSSDCSNCGSRQGSAARMDLAYGIVFWS